MNTAINFPSLFIQWLATIAQKLGRPEFESSNTITVEKLRNLISKLLMFFKKDNNEVIIIYGVIKKTILDIMYFIRGIMSCTE